jgi:glycosyltransferase involved in cell wall biosynthesis
MPKSLLLIVNSPEFFISHRLPVALAARESGFDVHVATGPGPACRQIVDQGLSHHVISLSRSGRNPFVEFRSLWEIFRLMRTIRPSLVHLVTIKPVLYGGLMARIARVPAVVVAISGLGSVFVTHNRRNFWLREPIKWLYRLALGHPNIRVIFQNSDDRSVLVGAGAIHDDQTKLIKGSGVALREYPVIPEPAGVPVVIFAARLLKDKGVVEFVQAAQILMARNIHAKFWLVGAPDPGNPTSVNEEQITEWRQQGVVEPMGFRSDIADLFARSNVVALPSYYGEGLPKVLIEAAACGRAVVTTDHPGCRDAIEVGKTGILVPVRDSLALADAIQALIEDPVTRKQMGMSGRALAEREFAIERVVDAHLAIYRELLVKGAKQ